MRAAIGGGGIDHRGSRNINDNDGRSRNIDHRGSRNINNTRPQHRQRMRGRLPIYMGYGIPRPLGTGYGQLRRHNNDNGGPNIINNRRANDNGGPDHNNERNFQHE